jgi:hypothetical protein
LIQTPGKSNRSQEHEKIARKEKRRFLRARVDLVQITIRIASTHVIAQINAKRTTQNGLKSTNQATKEEGEKRNVKNTKNTINTTQKLNPEGQEVVRATIPT